MPNLDTSVPHIARVYDYWLGGKDNFAADRELGDRTLQAYPNLVFSVRAKVHALTWTPTCGIRTRSWPWRRTPWTSVSRSRSC
jgi:hypothetical protein